MGRLADQPERRSGKSQSRVQELELASEEHTLQPDEPEEQKLEREQEDSVIYVRRRPFAS